MVYLSHIFPLWVDYGRVLQLKGGNPKNFTCRGVEERLQRFSIPKYENFR